ncbi:MAG: Sodium/hydrogen exchanger [Hyphomicrobiales bacterium]|nr:Sodium/hydrogen exchanger [Hyphomicrobiales bacterium]
MEQHLDLDGYKEFLVFLTTAGIVAPVFRRLRISPVLGFIAAGFLLGPFGLGRLAADWPMTQVVAIANVSELTRIAELGVAFLLFMIGLELSFERLRRMRKMVFGLGAAQVCLCAVVIMEAALLAGVEPTAAMVIGCALALSSTAIVLPTLAENRRLNSPPGRAAFAILLFQDLMVAPFLFVITMIGASASADAGLGSRFLYAIVPALLALVAIVGIGRLLIRPLFHHVAQARSTEFFMAACLLVITGAGVAAAAAGLSMSLGAFVAGLLLAETEYRREVEVTIEPFKGLLLGLFFMTVGAGLDLAQVIAHPMATLGLAALLIAGKTVLVYGLMRFGRFAHRVSLETALLAAPGGEFAFVMLAAAAATGLVDKTLAANLILAVTLSMIAIPFLAWSGGRRAAPLSAPDAMAGFVPDIEHSGHVIVVGHGRVGALVADMLTRHDIPYIAVDGDARLVKKMRDEGRPIYFGDASRPDFLLRCGIGEARALVLTMDAPKAAELVVAAARAQRPDMTIVARARDALHATHLYELGATDAIPETIEASLQLAEAVLVDIGVPMGFVIASIHEKRDEFRSLLMPRDAVARERRAIRLSKRVKEMGRARDRMKGGLRKEEAP